MEWYYPVLGGAVRGARPDTIDERWDEFVVPGLGIRCVDNRPWVTGAETCELVMALDAMGDSVPRTNSSRPCTTCVRTTARTGPVSSSPRQAVARGAHHLDRGGHDPGRRCNIATSAASGMFRGTDLPRGLEGEYDCACATAIASLAASGSNAHPGSACGCYSKPARLQRSSRASKG